MEQAPEEIKESSFLREIRIIYFAGPNSTWITHLILYKS